MKFEIILADKNYDNRECFYERAKQQAIPEIPVRQNATLRAKGLYFLEKRFVCSAR